MNTVLFLFKGGHYLLEFQGLLFSDYRHRGFLILLIINGAMRGAVKLCSAASCSLPVLGQAWLFGSIDELHRSNIHIF